METATFTINAYDLRTGLTATCAVLDTDEWRPEQLWTIQWHITNTRAVFVATNGWALVEYGCGCVAPGVNLHCALPVSSMHTLRKMLKHRSGDIDVSVEGGVWDFGIGADMLRVCTTHTPVDIRPVWEKALASTAEPVSVPFDPALLVSVLNHAPRPIWIHPPATSAATIITGRNYRALVMPISSGAFEPIAPGSLLANSEVS